MSAATKNTPKKPSTIARTVHYYWRVTRIQLPMFLFAILSTLGFVFFLSYANPFIVGLIVDRVSAEPVAAEQVFEVFSPYIFMLVGANILGQFFSKMQDYTVWKLELKAHYALATHVFDTLSNQSMTFHTNRHGGSLVSQTQKFIGAYSTLLESSIYAVIPITSSAVFTLVMLVGRVPLYVLILFSLLVVYLVASYHLYKRILPLNAKAAGAQNALSGELSDSITNILSVKTYGREAFERTLFDSANKQVLAADSKRMRASITRGAITSFITVIIMTLVVIFITGGNAWFGISAGTLVMMFTYTYSLTMQFNRINITFTQLNRGLGDAHDMTIILDEPTLVADVSKASQLKVSKGDISIENVTFWYADAAETDTIFEHFNLEIPAGQRVGLVGRSGSGKTTLTTLLLRLSNLQEGRILVDGQDIACATQVSLRQQIGYVPQEPLLFHRSIRENIAYGKPDASDEEIREAALKANALEFIEALPSGFDTHTGERGVKLSGGQRQRVAIARAILAAAPILVLDEATSALDSESEKLIQDALKNLMEGRTSIVVAHRLSTVASLDRIIVLREGKIVEDGTHAELIEAGGEYAQLWSRQSGAFLDDTI
ncbi:MAG: ABC transporter ATP-binding protein/permease [Eggerthellaceae bacterium]|nr:ABC transporter ATP-binding protein/permease [Eggerthellaceae bacterium]